jgi:ankyrin repeat protein
MGVLLLLGADVSKFSRNPRARPLWLAARNGDIEVVKLLLNKGAKANETNGSDSDPTALHIAARNGHHRVVELLLEHGADLAVRNKFGDTAAARSKDSRVLGLLLDPARSPKAARACADLPKVGSEDSSRCALM